MAILMATNFPILVGHNDVLSRLLEAERADSNSTTGDGEHPTARGFFERGEQGHIDLPRAREGGFAGGLFSIYVSADPQAPPPAGPVLGENAGRENKFSRGLH